MQLLLSQKNRLFEEIEFFKLSPLQFSFSVIEEDIIIRHIESDYYLKLKESRYHYCRCQFIPAEESFLEEYDCTSFEDVLNYFAGWIENVKRETGIEDKWQRLLMEAKSINISYTDNNSKFSVIEFELLKDKLESLKKELYHIKIDDTRLDLINIKLDYLLEQGKYMNKNDWKSLFIGTFLTIIIQLSITHEQGLAIWKIIKHIFGSYLLP